VLPRIPRVENKNVLVGFDTSDDAGVYQLTPDTALVQTVDFFTPIVDDPFLFGAVAAANALSDVYAMGGRPLTALSILAYPGKGDLDELAAILQGGASKIHEAGCVVIGGHSIADDEIKFGYAVTGIVNPARLLTNAGACPGDVLVLTKALGTGVISTALKRGLASEADVEASIASMLRLNREACEALADLDAHACTDITGFGLVGHLREMALASGVTIEIDPSRLRFLPGALGYAEAGAVPGGLKNNREFAASCVADEGSADEPHRLLLYDPQTSGGLAVAFGERDAARLLERIPDAYRFGRVLERGARPIHIL
jgi:selenide, water dikinase